MKITLQRHRTEFKGSESRQYSRIQGHHLVRCLFEEGKRCDWHANLTNISETGMRICTSRHMALDDITQFMINFKQWNFNITVAARVVWKRRLAGTCHGYSVGLSFLDMNPVHRYFLRKYVLGRLI